MKGPTSTVLLFLILLLAVLPVSAQETDWQTYTSEAYGFTVMFPGTPEETQQTVPSQKGALDLTMISYDASQVSSAQNMLYAVGYSDYSTVGVSVNNEEQQVQVLDGAVNGMITNIQGELLSEEDIELAEMPGREIRVGLSDNTHMIVSRLYLVHNIVYVLMVITTVEKDNNPSLTRFLDSFTFLPGATNPVVRASLPAGAGQTINSAEPGRTIELRLDGRVYTLREGEPLQLDGTFDNPRVTAQIADTRIFTLGSLSFEYPQQFLYEYEEDDGMHTWTLEGNAISIMLFHYPGEAATESTLDEFVTGMSSEFSTAPVVATIEKKFGDRTLRGRRLGIETNGVRVHYEIFSLDTDNGMTLLAFNDVLGDDGRPSEESNQTQALLARTITYK